MGVLNPLLLLLGAAAAVPLLLHLLQRHQGPRVAFPALRYLRRAEKESARRIRVRQVLLMLLRVAAMLLIAFAAARPFVRIGGAGHSPTAVVLILDNSMSTGAVTGDSRVLDELKTRALDVLELAGPDDRFWLLRAASSDPALPGDAATTALRVRETEPVAGAADIASAVQRARTLLVTAADGRAPEIHLLTDAQRTSLPRMSGDVGDPPLIVWHPASPAPSNRAVGAIEVGGGIAPIAGQRTTLIARIDGTGDQPADVRLVVGERLIAVARARAGEAAVLQLPTAESGWLRGYVEVDADALTADDRRWFAAPVAPPPTVAVPADEPFLRDAIEVLIEAGRVRRGVTGSADVAITRAAETMNAAGTTVVLPPASPAELGAVNRRLAAAGIPWRYGAPSSGQARFAAAAEDALDRALTDARVALSYPIEPAGDAAADSVLLRLTDGSAWAVRGERRGGRGTFILLGSPLDAEATSIPTDAAMLPLLDRLTGAWSLAAAPALEHAPGAEIALPVGATGVRRPDGGIDDVTGQTRYRTGTEPGLYEILSGDVVSAAFAVNPPAAESVLERADTDALRASLPGDDVHIASDADDYAAYSFRERLGRELWRPLLFALLVLLAIEMGVAATGRARRHTATPAAAA